MDIRGAEVSSKEVGEKVKKWDTAKWKATMQEKESLKMYREWRGEIGGQEKIYDNSEASSVLFKCRSNNLNLADRKRFKNEPTTCVMCGAEKEDLNHFLLQCVAYSDERQKNILLQRPYNNKEDNVIGTLLFDNKTIEESKRTIYKFWKMRENKINSQV